MTLLAYDRAGSVRTFDEDGRLRVERTPISKANICEYAGAEIPDSVALGLDPEKHYRLLRDPNELEKAADTFNSLPVLEDHTPTSAAAHPRELTVGSTMDNARFEAPYLTIGMVIFDGPMIQRIQSGEQREISCGYKYTADMTPGTYEGQPYDGRMTNIRGNHIALVEKGRAGSDVMVNDSAQGMKTVADPTENTASGGNIEQIVDLLRQDAGDTTDDQLRAAVSQMLAGINKETDKPGPGGEDEDDAPLPRRDEAEDDETKRQDDRLTKMEDFMRQEGFTLAQASKCREMCAEMLKGEAEDADETAPNSGAPEKETEDEDEEEKRKQAMDSKINAALAAERARLRNAEVARQMVRPLVGEVHGMDSASQVYRYALTHSGLAFDSLRGVNAAGLRALVNTQLRALRPAPQPMATDSADVPFSIPRQLG